MIGVIGGNGVAATARLASLVENKVTLAGAFRDAHHPQIIFWQATKAPSRSMFLEGRGKSFIPDYVEIGKKLKQCGCTTLCMCCNTAHFAVDTLEEQIGLPFINLLKEVAIKCNALQVKRVGMMCSDGLRKTLLYDKYFLENCKDATLIYPNEDMQNLVTKGICNAKNSVRENLQSEEHPFKLFSEVCNHLVEQEVDCIVGGCTDISAVFSPPMYKNVVYVDSLDVLADAILERAKDRDY